jgi:hypothetical protein
MFDMTDYYELAQPFDTNPDPNFAGCLNSQKEERGVVFPGIEPAEASYCFIGESSIYEAVAALNGSTVKRIKQLIGADKKSAEALAKAEAELDVLRDKVERWNVFVEKAEDAGIFTRVFD